jgi:7,8-dihydro-6-hydroxymethylpterin-pyrophosphokinase
MDIDETKLLADCEEYLDPELETFMTEIAYKQIYEGEPLCVQKYYTIRHNINAVKRSFAENCQALQDAEKELQKTISDAHKAKMLDMDELPYYREKIKMINETLMEILPEVEKQRQMIVDLLKIQDDYARDAREMGYIIRRGKRIVEVKPGLKLPIPGDFWEVKDSCNEPVTEDAEVDIASSLKNLLEECIRPLMESQGIQASIGIVEVEAKKLDLRKRKFRE